MIMQEYKNHKPAKKHDADLDIKTMFVSVGLALSFVIILLVGGAL